MCDAPDPILVFCEGTANRSSLASGIYDLVSAGQHAGHAAEQLSLRDMHFPDLGSRIAAMDNTFAIFASNWVRASDQPFRTASN